MLAMYGGGTQMLESQLKARPELALRRIVRVDTDTKESPTPYHPGDILVGTQSAWSVITWKDITVMAFVDADTSLFVPEYMVTEELWQRIGLAAFSTQGLLFIQTAHPDHYVFQALQNPTIFYSRELAARKLFGYPPYTTLVKFFVPQPTIMGAERAGHAFYSLLCVLTKKHPEITIAPNQPAFPYFYRGGYWQILLAKIKGNDQFSVAKIITARLPVGWKIDINPNAILNI